MEIGRAGYVLLEIGNGDPRLDFIRVEYDVKRAADAIRSSDLPADFAEFLESGGRLAAKRT